MIGFWSFVLILCAGAFGYLFYDTITKFFSYPVNVEVSVRHPIADFGRFCNGYSWVLTSGYRANFPLNPSCLCSLR